MAESLCSLKKYGGVSKNPEIVELPVSSITYTSTVGSHTAGDDISEWHDGVATSTWGSSIVYYVGTASVWSSEFIVTFSKKVKAIVAFASYYCNSYGVFVPTKFKANDTAFTTYAQSDSTTWTYCFNGESPNIFEAIEVDSNVMRFCLQSNVAYVGTSEMKFFGYI